MRMCLDRMPKKELHGQHPVVTLPTKQALNQFESQQKTRPVPPTQSNNGPPPPSQRSSGPESMSRSQSVSQSSYQQQSHQPRLMSSNGQSQYRPHMQSQGGPPGSGQAPQRVQQQPLMPHPPMALHSQQQQQQPMRYPQQNQSQWNNGPPRPGPNGPPRPGPGMNGPPGPPQHRPMVISHLVLVLRRIFFVLILLCSELNDFGKRSKTNNNNVKYDETYRKQSHFTETTGSTLSTYKQRWY